MKAFLISVIIPIYNAESYLDRCISSICEQTYRDLEIILVNDGSTDASLDICLKYQQKDNRIRVLSQKNKGIIEARKLGVQSAQGNIIGFVDSDDWIESDMYMQMMQILKYNDVDLISSGIIRNYENSKTKNIYDNYEEGLYLNLEESIYQKMLFNEKINDFGIYCNLVNKLFKKELLQKIYENINPNIFYGEDALAIYTYCLKASSIYIMKKSFYHYKLRKGSTCLEKNEKLLSNSFLLYSELKKQFYNYKEPYILMRQLKKYILHIEAHNLKMLYSINIYSLGTWHFNYPEIIQNKKIIIYGAGACGQAFYEYLYSKDMEKQVIAWIDKDPTNKSEQCLHIVESPDILSNLVFDYIIISVLKESVAEEIRKELLEQYQLKEEKVIWRKPEHIPIF